MSSIPLRRIPKQYQEPRPTAVRERRRSFWRWLPVWLRASGATLLVLSLTPLAPLDEMLTVSSFELLASRQPSATALRLRVDADALLHADCGTAIADRLREGGAFDWIALEPLESLCPVPGAVQVPRGAARRDMLGRVAGFREAENSEVALLALDEWVSPLPAGALPTLDWHQLERGRVAPDLLRGRRVLLTPALDDSLENDQLERAVAAAVTGEGGRRRLPAWLLLPVAGAVAAVWGRLVLSRGYRVGLLAAAALLATLGALAVCLAKYASFAVLPLASMALAWLTGSVTLVAPALMRRWRARLRADEWLVRAALARERGLDQLDDAEFHSKIASLAEQSHPANLVLIAQLRAREWHLEFWSHGSAGEELIDERRRDVRRAPYCDDQGLPTIRVIHDYLVMKEMPVLVVPLQALGELEGYVFLCGDRAETAHRSDPSIAARLSVELALLMCRRRVARAALGGPEPDTPKAALESDELASGAQIVGDEMDLLDAMSLEAPVGLMLADSFGHVRRLSREFASWLERFGATLPPLRDGVLVPAGALTLASVLEALLAVPADAARSRLAELLSSREVLRLSLRAPAAHGGDALVLCCRALRRTVMSVEHVTGFVLTLTPSAGASHKSSDSLRISVRGEELSAFPLASVVRDAIAGANRSLRRQVLLEPNMTMAYCIGKRDLLAAALRGFLTDSAMQDPPVISLREKSRDLELIIHDLELGVPPGALDRVMNAPHHPPAGLEALARLIRAVEDCHGSMRVMSGRGWGSRLIVRLHRARSVVMVGHSRHPSAVAVSEGATRSSVPPQRPRSTDPPAD